jgi:hypothetical protein
MSLTPLLLGKEAGLTVDAALDNVQRIFRKKNAGTTRHGTYLKMLNVSDPFGCGLDAMQTGDEGASGADKSNKHG